ncbi:uncharacterized protein SCHCODRAFT_02688860 [Schizophyllum commune H4-8]|nr:uncharacterized protein SCHCODRAFT_02688860 [Schizophyllum commune H4-8]KAI5892530.1 hypothetical protein SCHCODRAFT_02688860 [Schizophyllum commune H4-8]
MAPRSQLYEGSETACYLCFEAYHATCEVERLVAVGDTSKWPRTLDFALLQRFVAFNNLTDLTIGCWGGFLLDDDELCRMAQAWPQLEIFTLQTKRVMRPIACTILALVAFARYCPRLRYLGLDFNAEPLTYDPTATHGVRQGALRSLEVYRSPIRSARVVAAFISSLFPGVDTVSTANSVSDPGADDPEVRYLDEDVEKARTKRWRQVERLLPLLKVVRAEGRLESASPGVAANAEPDAGMVFADVDYDTDYSDVRGGETKTKHPGKYAFIAQLRTCSGTQGAHLRSATTRALAFAVFTSLHYPPDVSHDGGLELISPVERFDLTLNITLRLAFASPLRMLRIDGPIEALAAKPSSVETPTDRPYRGGDHATIALSGY